jgi:hypothetical protein
LGYLFAVVWLLILIFFAIRFAQQHQWVWFAGFVLVGLAFLAVPAGGMKWFGRVMKIRKPRAPANLGIETKGQRRGTSVKRRPRYFIGRWPTGAPWATRKPADLADIVDYQADGGDPPEREQL